MVTGKDPHKHSEKADITPPEALHKVHFPFDIHLRIFGVIKKNRLMPDEEQGRLLSLISRMHNFFALLPFAEDMLNIVTRDRAAKLSKPYQAVVLELDREFLSRVTPQEQEYLLNLVPKLAPTAEVRKKFLEIYELAYRLTLEMGTALTWAQRAGDRTELAAHVRGGGHISPEMREYLAALIEGKALARAQNRHVSLRNAKRDRTITWFVLRARAAGVGDDLSIEQACERFRLGKRYIQQIFKAGRNSETSLLERTNHLLDKLQALVKDMGVFDSHLLEKMDRDAP
jgi:hypothetical protein